MLSGMKRVWYCTASFNIAKCTWRLSTKLEKFIILEQQKYHWDYKISVTKESDTKEESAEDCDSFCPLTPNLSLTDYPAQGFTQFLYRVKLNQDKSEKFSRNSWILKLKSFGRQIAAEVEEMFLLLF